MMTNELKQVRDALEESLSNTWQDQARKVEIENIAATLDRMRAGENLAHHLNLANRLNGCKSEDVQAALDDEQKNAMNCLQAAIAVTREGKVPNINLLLIVEAALTAQPAESVGDVVLEDFNSLVHHFLTGRMTLDDVKYVLQMHRHTIRRALSKQNQPDVNAELLEALKELCPLELVHGDAIQRTNPHSRQMLNSSAVWAVSVGNRSALRVRKAIEFINQFITRAEQKEGRK